VANLRLTLSWRGLRYPIIEAKTFFKLSSISGLELERTGHSELVNNAPKIRIAGKRIENLKLHAARKRYSELGRSAAFDLAEHGIGFGIRVFAASQYGILGLVAFGRTHICELLYGNQSVHSVTDPDFDNVSDLQIIDYDGRAIVLRRSAIIGPGKLRGRHDHMCVSRNAGAHKCEDGAKGQPNDDKWR
jgi:hypothetical protein